MSDSSCFWLAVDVGNSRVKAGLFDCHSVRLHNEARSSASGVSSGSERTLPKYLAGTATPLDEPPDFLNLVERQCRGAEVHGVIAGSNQEAVTRVALHWPAAWPAPLIIRSSEGFPLTIRVREPRRVGLDRLFTAIAAARLKSPDQSAIVVDCGTATTVNLIAPENSFEGGAILPGFALTALALHQYTEVLPLIPIEDVWKLPAGETGHPLPGRSTEEAMLSGVFWGQVGAVRELIARLSATVTEPSATTDSFAIVSTAREPLVLLTGGGARLLHPHFPTAHPAPHLALQGLTLTASHLMKATSDHS